ncbi:MAG TPA: CHASE3 domain-containing protein [Blastocatellia bacterium]|nr:CHASE3 domain-containing protein [Blastocatellia bacterium]
MNIGIDRRAFGGLILALSTLIGIGWASYQSINNLITTNHEETHSYVVLRTLEDVYSQLKEVERGQNAYVVTGDAKYLEPVYFAINVIGRDFRSLRELTSDNSQQQRWLDALEPTIKSRLALVEEVAAVRRDRGFEASRPLVGREQERRLMDEIRHQLYRLQDDEQRLLKDRVRVGIERARSTVMILVTGTMTSIVLLLGAFFLIRREVLERREVEAELRRTRDELDQRVRQRTAELQWSNENFLNELDDRKQVEAALQESQAHITGIIGSAMDAIIAVDSEQRVMLFNAAAEKMFGCSADEVLGRPLDRFIPERFRAAHHEHIPAFGQAHVTKRRMGALGAVFGLRANGEEFPIEASISQIDVAGQVLYTVILRDITERLQHEAETRRLNEELEHRVIQRTSQLQAANRELEAFTYSVSHDLRAPLRAIGGFARILIEEYQPHLPEEAQHYLRTVQDNAEQMGHLIDDLLAFSRLGRQALNKQTIAPSAMAKAVIADLWRDYAGRQVDVEVGELPMCQADPALLKQVFINLLANAFKFTSHCPVASIEIGCQNGDPQLDRPIYFIKDNGAGFDMRYVHKLFGVFQRLHRAEDYEGTGVGLAIVQRIIHRHGGRVWAESEVGHGATFYFTLEEEANDGTQHRDLAG